MAAPTTLPKLLSSIEQSLASVSEATPKLSSLAPPQDGLSLLDVKNEMLMSYLEHMLFLVLLKLRNEVSKRTADRSGLSLAESDMGQSTVKKLVELRHYLEKGVRPVEEKLRYQIEKALRAAEDVERAANAKVAAAAAAGGEDVSGSASDASDSEEGSGDDDDDDNDEEDEDAGAFRDEEGAAAVRPNRAAFVRPASSTAAAAAATATTATSGRGKESEGAGAGGVYRPPRIAPTMMPTTGDKRRDRSERRPLKSATMDEFVADELSMAPVAELSIGTNIGGRGRHMKTATERQQEEERRDYEERNFVRLPKQSKKDRARGDGGGGGGRAMAFGGEEWRGLGEGVDRINRLTQRKSGGGGGGSGSTRAMLDKSRKRGIDTVDGPRGSGGGGDDGMVGGRFQKKLRQMGRRDRGKR
ncbi:u3 small nucleolar ribonucleoprotein [Niveomyces insectorum RCEF 264]|uniref:U3 small nucleolar ribonucleoprotein n=1 Tax=Niveomyces insectorum RCEF 264 TaxID=1081102 RepID=A0A162JC33_9HYPO|nr:u3 small nucleolar ribonucleoprotein [Niveomyces insectorum RCEF 264]